MAVDIKKNDRGFMQFGSMTDDYGATLEVSESSAISSPACLWLRIDGGEIDNNRGRAHMTVARAKELLELLQAAIANAEDPDNWRNTAEYREAFLKED